MPQSYPERRKLARLPLEVLLRIHLPGSEEVAFAETRDVSARGIYFYTHLEELQPGEELQCVMVLPEKLTLAAGPTLVGCRGKILRVNRELSDNRVGVAMEVSSYDFSWHEDMVSDAEAGAAGAC